MKTAVEIIFAIAGCMINMCYWKKNSEEQQLIPKTVKGKLGVGVMFGMMIIIAIVLAVGYPENTLPFNLKRIGLLLVLFPAALSDYRTHTIPNRVLLLGLIYWDLATVVELVLDFEQFRVYLFAEIMITLITFAALMMLRLLVKEGVGMGDIKLLMLMGLAQAGEGFVSSVMTSLIILFVVAVVSLITKKKSRKDFVPFGPEVLAGTYISIFLMGA